MTDDKEQIMQDDEWMSYDRRQCTTHLQPYEQLLMGWIVGGTVIMMTGNTMREGAGGYDAMTREQRDTTQNRRTTYLQSCKPMLVGWILGGTVTG
jgi:hypothetical protein